MQMSLPAQVPGGMAAVGSVTEHGRRVGLEAARGARRRRVGPSRRPAHRRLRQSWWRQTGSFEVHILNYNN